MTIKVFESTEAVEEFNKWSPLMKSHEREKLLNATILCEQDEYQIISGPDLMSDRAGFGKSISSALYDYVSIYFKKNHL